LPPSLRSKRPINHFESVSLTAKSLLPSASVRLPSRRQVSRSPPMSSQMPASSSPYLVYQISLSSQMPASSSPYLVYQISPIVITMQHFAKMISTCITMTSLYTTAQSLSMHYPGPFLWNVPLHKLMPSCPYHQTKSMSTLCSPHSVAPPILPYCMRSVRVTCQLSLSLRPCSSANTFPIPSLRSWVTSIVVARALTLRPQRLSLFR